MHPCSLLNVFLFYFLLITLFKYLFFYLFSRTQILFLLLLLIVHFSFFSHSLTKFFIFVPCSIYNFDSFFHNDTFPSQNYSPTKQRICLKFWILLAIVMKNTYWNRYNNKEWAYYYFHQLDGFLGKLHRS